MAAQGLRNLDRGEETITDDNLAAKLSRQGRKVHAESVLVALLLTAVFVLIPAF